MKRNPSWKINEDFKLLNNEYDDIIKTAIQYQNTLNENNLQKVEELLDEASLRGWYPFVSEIYKNPNNVHKFDYIDGLKKDEIIFGILMLEKEVDILEDFGEINLEDFKNRIKIAKDKL